MGLSSDLISQFVKVTNDKKETKRETTTYGTIVKNDSSTYVKLDGSDLSTPVVSTAFVNNGDRVTVMIKNHTAIVTGNISSPSANNTAVTKAVNQISEFETLMAYKVNTKELAAAKATIESLKAKITDTNVLKAATADIESLQTKFADLEYVNADDVTALNADIENLRTTFGKFMSISAEDLKAINADIDQLRAYTADFTYVSADVLHAIKADIDSVDIKYADVDFSNISEATMGKFYAESGLIKDATINSGTITGELTGVTITGDLIKANTIAADKLLLKGTDGLYHKLNTDGTTVEAEQTDYNSLNGSVIAAKSIAATKISVSDLVSFGATIGGFNISTNSIYSGVKESVSNTTKGIYLDNDGQIAFGNSDKYIKFFKDTDNAYKLLISGAVTANENFKILEDGSMEAKNGSFKGTVNADNGAIGGINISDGELSTITMDADNIPTGFEIKSDGTFISKGGANYDYVRSLEVKSGALHLSSFYSPSGTFGSGTVLNANGLYFKEGDATGQTLGSIHQDLDGTMYLTSSNGGIVLNSNGLTTVQNGLKVNNIVGGYYQNAANDKEGTSGYLNIAEIKLSRIYANSLIEMGITRRDDNRPTKILIRFANANTTDPNVKIFDIFNGNVKAYIAKTATSTWNIYVEKSGAYDSIAVLYAHYNGQYMGSDVITYKNAFVSSLPSGYITSGYASGFSGYHYSQVYGFHESPSLIRGRSADGGFDFYFKQNGMRIVFDGANGKIWRVDTSGTWTTLAG